MQGLSFLFRFVLDSLWDCRVSCLAQLCSGCRVAAVILCLFLWVAWVGMWSVMGPFPVYAYFSWLLYFNYIILSYDVASASEITPCKKLIKH